ncbi:hypothetical protein Tco_1008001 [Tanacetum coccineum]
MVSVPGYVEYPWFCMFLPSYTSALHIADCRWVWLLGYMSVLRIVDVFGSTWFGMILPGYTSALDCRCVWLPGYTSALWIADVFGSAWFHMILPGYTSTLRIADVFGCLVTRLLYKLQMCLDLVLL